MNLEKVVFAFFILLAATLNFGFFIGDIANPELHSVYELFRQSSSAMIATVLKFGDRTQIGRSTRHQPCGRPATDRGGADLGDCGPCHGRRHDGARHVERRFAVGRALFANIVSVVILIIETVMLRR